MSRLRVRPSPPDAAGVVLDVTPQSAGWSHVGFRMLKLSAGATYAACEPARETCVVVLAGTADITAGGKTFAAVGGRLRVFDDTPPGAVYVPQQTAFRIEASGDAEIALCTAPGAPGFSPRLIPGEAMTREVRGAGANTRHVRNILPQDAPAHSLLVVEVLTPSGHWSSYPPHKHDTAGDGETALEETYYHRLDPPQGFAVQRVYTDDRSLDETVSVEDGDVVMVPRGYHPVGAPFGYDLYYLNVMAGPKREWMFRNDPAHDWIVKPKPAAG